MASQGRMVCGLDIGTTKVCAIIGEIGPTGTIDVIGVGTDACTGLRKGVVMNIQKTLESIRKAVEEAELMSGYDVRDVFVGIAGAHIQAKNSRGVIAVNRKGGIIAQDDVDRVIEAAQAVPLQPGRRMLHVVPQTFVVDDQAEILDPVGMNGVRLEGEVHIVTGDVSKVQSLLQAVEGAGLRVADIVLEPLASSMAVLDEDEKEMGVAMVDIGGGTTDVAIFSGSCIRHTSSIPIGGDLVTTDVSYGLKVPKGRAEEIKKKHGSAMQALVPRDSCFVVPGVGANDQRELTRLELAAIIEPRMVEIYRSVAAELRQLGLYQSLGAGLVLTGGGSLLPGAAELAHSVIGLPVRLGTPRGFGGLIDSASTPKHATGVGLVLCGQANSGPGTSGGTVQGPNGDRIKDLLGRMTEWVSRYF
ncbi:MAG: cell division protein FtsA [Fibrobacteria bacterium]|nr:cell division protein FtsA [Fibrobacteria bacterium]